MKGFLVRSITGFVILFSLCLSAFGQTNAFDVSRMDTSADACENFFEFANGTWVKNTQIPPAFSRWGTFNILADNNQAILKDILENAAQRRLQKAAIHN